MPALKILIIIRFVTSLSITSYPQWVSISSSPSGQINDIVKMNDTIYIAHSNNGIFKSTNGTQTWQQITNGLNSIQTLSAHQILVSGNSIFIATADGIYKSNNKGID